MADLGIIFSQEKTHHPLIPVIIYNYYRKYPVPFFLGHPVYRKINIYLGRRAGFRFMISETLSGRFTCPLSTLVFRHSGRSTTLWEKLSLKFERTDALPNRVNLFIPLKCCRGLDLLNPRIDLGLALFIKTLIGLLFLRISSGCILLFLAGRVKHDWSPVSVELISFISILFVTPIFWQWSCGGKQPLSFAIDRTFVILISVTVNSFLDPHVFSWSISSSRHSSDIFSPRMTTSSFLWLSCFCFLVDRSRGTSLSSKFCSLITSLIWCSSATVTVLSRWSMMTYCWWVEATTPNADDIISVAITANQLRRCDVLRYLC